MDYSNHSYRDFASWAHTFSQYTNQSLAGASLLVDEAGSNNAESNTRLRNQAEAWGMNVIESDSSAVSKDTKGDSAAPSQRSNVDSDLPIADNSINSKPFVYRYIPESDNADTQDSNLLNAGTPAIPDMRQASGLEAMDYAQAHMPVTRELMKRLTGRGSANHNECNTYAKHGTTNEANNQQPETVMNASPIDFSDARIATCLILEPKTAVLLRELKAARAQVGVCCEPGGVDERVAEQLRAEGIAVEAKNDWTSEQYHDGALRLLDTLNPNIIIDDGASFARLAARERPEIVENLIGVAEETTSGVRAFQAMQDDDALPYPVVAVNDSALKTDFDNAHGTGETCVTTIQELLGAQWFAGRNVTVIGFGPVGRGFALRVRALGAHVTVCDIDPVACLKAVFEGFPAADIDEALPETDMAVSATGVRHTLALEHLRLMKPNAMLTVVGGIADEIALDDIPSFHRQPGRDVTTIRVPDGPELTLLAQGDGVNYTAGGGNPIEIMDLSFAVQLSAVAHLIKNQGNLPNEVIRLDAATDREIAGIALQVRGYQASHAVADNGYSWKTTRFDAMQD
ncbi:adenosylhomocysteinase [Bifidobacterium sp. ESL0775]|uniref:adenosylhomocysteinase n=1 Tax=Bifidobacterium sp. ESL0775 TaxID=2983230 RepID=UPI0023F953D8|nr:adenosylhomocysteinase [Bifidobacterium sp. ESL0775]WEV68988.1 adenosylhomocysteinase [Bifidobacterium sp. ESL0775]